MASYTKTVVFTDLANYTQSTAKVDRSQLRQLIADHEAHTQRLFDPYGGQLVKNLGDSFMALFDSSTDALRACMDLVESTIALGDKEMSFRASACTGDVEEINGDYFGEAVNLSARINSKTPAGEMWFANRTRLCMNQKEIPWESVGSFDFKGIPDTIECFRAVPPGQCILPEAVEGAVKLKKQIMISSESPDFDPTTITRDHYVILTGFELGTNELRNAVSRLPATTPPGQMWLQVTNIPGAERKAWLDAGRGMIVGSPEAMVKALTAAQVVIPGGGSQTVFMDLSGGGDVSLDLVGLALPAVPMAGVIQGYSFDMLPDGAWGFSKGGAKLRVTVNMGGISVTTYSPDILINGRRVPPNTTEQLRDGFLIRTPQGQVRYRALTGTYRGMLIGAPTFSMEARAGEGVEMGREPNFPGFTLPDRGGLDRIQWAAGGRAQKARQAGLTLDRSMTGRHQAILKVMSPTEFTVAPIHQRIPTWLFSNDQLDRVLREQKAGFGDMIVIGTNVICINKPLF
jgi:hypothetical protein